MSKFTHKSGEDFSRDWQVSLLGDPVDLTGYTGVATVRTKAGAFVERLTVTFPEPLSGLFRVSASAALTVDWPPGLCQYDVKLTSPDGRVTKTATVDFLEDAGVTRG